MKSLFSMPTPMSPTGYQSFQTFKTLQSFKNRTAMTGDLRVQMNRDELSRGNPDDRLPAAALTLNGSLGRRSVRGGPVPLLPTERPHHRSRHVLEDR
jgi:hypothetical protein